MQNCIANNKNRINVLVLITVMDRAGAETMMMNYLRHIDRAKIHIDFLINRPQRADYEDEIEKLGSTVYHMSAISPGKVNKYKQELTTFLAKHPEYQIIHSHLEERSYYAMNIAKEMNIPMRIVHAHSNLKHKNLKYLMRLYLRKRLEGTYTHAFACGKGPARWLFGSDAGVTIVKNAVDTNDFKYDEEKRQRARTEIGIDDDTLLIGHIGRFSYEKNHHFLLDIFNDVNKRRPNSKLVLIGGGEHKNEKKIKKEILYKMQAYGLEDKVIFLGVRDDMSYIMQAIDIFVLPSSSEGFPMTLVEAQSLGLRCLASDQVPKEINITGRVRTMSLQMPSYEWASEIVEFAKKETEHQEMNRLVKSAGYDIVGNAKWLQSVYEEVRPITENEVPISTRVMNTKDRGMQVMKVWYHLKSKVKKIGYKILFGNRVHIGKGTTWRQNFHIAIEGGEVEIGRNCFFNHGCSVNALKKVTIGDGTIFGANCHIYDHNHRFTDTQASIKEQGYTVGETRIGKHCWFGTNVVVLKGVNIGDNCVIGAGVVVSEDVPEGTVIKG